MVGHKKMTNEILRRASVPIENTIQVPASGISNNYNLPSWMPYFYITKSPHPVLVYFDNSPTPVQMDVGHGGIMIARYLRFQSFTGLGYEIKVIHTQAEYNVPKKNTGPGTGVWELLNTVNVSGSPQTVELITAQNPSNYSAYKIFISNALLSGVAAPPQEVRCRLSTDGGLSWVSTANHRWTQEFALDNGTGGNGGQNGVTGCRIVSNPGTGLGGFHGEMIMIEPGSFLPKVTLFNYSGQHQSARLIGEYMTGYYPVSSPVNGLQFEYTSSLTFPWAQGLFEMWGIRRV